MSKSRLAEIYEYGQSIWIDYIRRDLMTSGQLKTWIDAGEVTGMTSNPTIFEKAIGGSDFYDDALRELIMKQPSASNEEIFEQLAIQDIKLAADELRPVYDRTKGLDGYVSLEVSPKLAYRTEDTANEAIRLFKTVARPNLMIKIPATEEGLPAIRKAISEGVNVNVTLMFSLQDYKDVADAYLSGLEDRLNRGEDISQIASVASFFVSRVDGVIDKKLHEGSPLRGKIAIANSKIAYDEFSRTFASDRFNALKQQGARVQRILWGSTSTKDPKYLDVLYIEELIGPNSVNTVPLKTLDAFRDHGHAAPTVNKDLDKAKEQIAALKEQGIDLEAILVQLKTAGVDSFIDSFDALIATLAKKREELVAPLG